MEWLLIPGIVLVLLSLVLWSMTHEIRLERARELFRLQHERLEKMFLDEAAKSGKPRGLRWIHCEFAPDFLLARDRQTKHLIALIDVTIQFEPIAGSDMELNPNAEMPRSGSAVFVFEHRHWLTHGKVIFNLSPTEALRHFENQYESLQ